MNQRSRDPTAHQLPFLFFEKKEEEKTSPSVRSLLPPFKHVKGRWSLFWEMAPLNLSLSHVSRPVVVLVVCKREKKDNNSNFLGVVVV
jgi:hypothetical protein